MQGLEDRNLASSPETIETDSGSSKVEQEVLQDVLRALRGLRYGSVVLTVHEGHVVEIQKTERIRKRSTKKS